MRARYTLGLLGGALSCGMSTHIQVSHLAMGYLKGYGSKGGESLSSRYYGLLKRNARALQAGSYFPDWGYACRNYEVAGEAAHWPPFYRAAVDQIRRKYPQELTGFLAIGRNITFPLSRTQHAFERLVAFLFGAVSHGVSDVAWHGQDGREFGFVPSLAAQDWGGDSFKAHKVADPGGDLALAHATSLDYFKSIWDIPVEDVLAIYRTLGYQRVRWWDFRRCMAMGLAAAQFTRYSGSGLFGKFGTDRSPFLIQNYMTYFHGGNPAFIRRLNSGLYNMATLVRYCWGDLMASIEGRLEGAFCPVQFPGGFTKLSYFGTSRSPFAEPSRIMQRDVNLEPSPSNLMEPEISLELASTSEISGLYPQGQFGTCLAVGRFYGDNRQQLVVSAPYAHSRLLSSNGTHLGKVFIYDAANLELIQELTSPGSWVNEARFGASLLALDVDDDGIEDLLVGAPSFSLPGQPYRGRVWIYFGRRGKGLSPVPDTFLEPVEGGGFFGFGQVLKAADLDGDGRGDLIVGCPTAFSQAGMVCSRLRSPKLKRMDWCVSRPDLDLRAGENFGAAIETFVSQNKTWVLVGAPGASGGGRVYAVDASSPFQTPLILAKGAPGSRFGTSLAVLNSAPLLAVGAPAETSGSHWQAGIVYQLKLSLDPPKVQSYPSEQLLAGQSSGSALGSVLVRYESGLLASEPLANWETGCIHSINRNPNRKPVRLTLPGTPHKARSGASVSLADIDGDGTLDLMAGQPHFTDLNRRDYSGQMVGRVVIIHDFGNKVNPPQAYPRLLNTSPITCHRPLLWILAATLLVLTLKKFYQSASRRSGPPK